MLATAAFRELKESSLPKATEKRNRGVLRYERGEIDTPGPETSDLGLAMTTGKKVQLCAPGWRAVLALAVEITPEES